VSLIALDHVQLAAPPGCEAEARRFFGGLLGLEELVKPDNLVQRGGVWFGLGQQQLHIGVEATFVPAIKAHPALVTDSEHLDALATRLVDAGEKVEWDDELPDARRFFTADPWGNRIEVLARL
jgi:extradiol dioxygenase family protein